MTDAAPTDEEAIAVYKVLMKATVKKGFNVKSKQASICSCRLRAPSRWPAWAAGKQMQAIQRQAMIAKHFASNASRPRTQAGRVKEGDVVEVYEEREVGAFLARRAPAGLSLP